MLPRIYTDQIIDIQHTVTLSKEISHHLVTVLRLKAGHTVYLFNGTAGDYEGVLLDTGKTAQVKIERFIPKNTESTLKIHLGQGLSRADRMDFTLQKATELGVQALTPIITEKCLVKLKADRLDKKQTHWQNILISAVEQSGRTSLPELHAPIELAKWVATPFEGISLVLDPTAEMTIHTLPQDPTHYRLLVGPESGLSSTEISYAKANGFQAIRLGPRILRTETAGMAIITALQTRFGDFQ